MKFKFRKLSKSDLPLVKKWLAQQYVAKWFDDTNVWIDEISSNLDSDWTRHYIAELFSNPVGFVQYYDTSKAPKGSWSSQLQETIGIDFFIGDPSFLEKKCGALLASSFVEFLIKKAEPKRIIADPEEGNIKSRHIFKKCGFKLEEKSSLFVKDIKTVSNLK